MKMIWKTRKSAGIRVEARVYKLIREGDAARDEGRWEDAVRSYRSALDLSPKLAHIFVQLGHAHKHTGRPEEADAAYADAARLRPMNADALWQRAQLAKHRGEPGAAISHLVALLRANPTHDEAQTELRRLLDDVGPVPQDRLLDRIEAAMATDSGASDPREKPTADALRARPLVFDLTDLIGHYREQRLVNGIQRVQTEVLSALLAERDAESITGCCFVGGREGWREVPLTLCRDLIRLSATGSDVEDPAWQVASAKLYLHLALAGPYVLPRRAVLINLGISFWMHDYFRFIRNAKMEQEIVYIPLVYDLIPIVKPEFCVPGWIHDVLIWLVGAFQHADGFLAISHSAKQDLLSAAALIGHAVPDGAVEVVPLDADFRRPGHDLPKSHLVRWQLEGSDFALLVSTLEPRKNHALAFDVWLDLLRRHGPDFVPQLVCVGRDGWMNDAVFDRLDTTPELAERVTLVHRVSDAELALLYRACQFTLFPSLYEGWGLPVTEALCHGRVTIAADNSSLPEAGAGLALHFASGSAVQLAAAVERVILDPAWREGREAQIKAKFAPRSWGDIARQIESAPERLLEPIGAKRHLQEVELGRYYPITLFNGARIWPGAGSGEIFRIGNGWLWPGAEGCRTKPEGGVLRLSIVADGPLRVYIGVRGLLTIDCPTTVSLNGVMVGRIVARHGKCGWVSCDLPDKTGSEFDLLVQGAFSELIPSSRGHHVASVAVVGFFVCVRDDAAANAAFLRARRTDLRPIDAYRENLPLNVDQNAEGARRAMIP